MMDATIGEGVAESHLLQGNDTEMRAMINIGMRMLMTDIPETMIGYLRANGYHK
jgi:hypothetical protein